MAKTIVQVTSHRLTKAALARTQKSRMVHSRRTRPNGEPMRRYYDPMRVGLFNESNQEADFLWNQCDQPLGRHRGMELARWDRSAEAALVFNWPAPREGLRASFGWRRYVYKAIQRPVAPMRCKFGYDWLGMPPEKIWTLLYEPPPIVPDWLMQLSHARSAHVYAPDARAQHPIALPSMWSIGLDVRTLRAMPPPEKPLGLVAISSGKTLIPGHSERLGFLHALRSAGVEMELFGRGLSGSLSSRGPVQDKSSVLLPARCALVVENHSAGEHYVSEKLWDALACWCLPLYFGSRAVDRLIPPDSFVRLPDLGEAGVRAVQEAMADPQLWRRRLDAIAQARTRALGDLRLVEWLARECNA
ncbi:hypothetical protein D4Q85_00725 [bacterium]|nr:MAG: hypothetical protein D4Q85_00725 [bacterium]